MFLAIDIGNTSITFGVFAGKRLVRHWRLPTNRVNKKTLTRTLKNPPSPPFTKGGSKLLPPFEKGGMGGFEGVCISSVVPRLNPILIKVIRKHFGCKTLFVSAKNAGIGIPRYNKKQIGADRLVNAVAAYEIYRMSAIVIDFGTATTFDYVTAKGEFGGGVIAPGIGIINDALTNMTARLPKTKIRKTKHIIAQNTKGSMQAGIFHGYVGLVDHISEGIKNEVKNKPKVIATGGFAKIIADHSATISTVKPTLTLEGLRIIWERNS